MSEMAFTLTYGKEFLSLVQDLGLSLSYILDNPLSNDYGLSLSSKVYSEMIDFEGDDIILEDSQDEDISVLPHSNG